jgi:hypothetical protein
VAAPTATVPDDQSGRRSESPESGVGRAPLSLTFSGPVHSAPPVTFAPRLLSCLRINQPVTMLTARLDSRLVANGYLRRLHTYKITRASEVASPETAAGLLFLFSGHALPRLPAPWTRPAQIHNFIGYR